MNGFCNGCGHVFDLHLAVCPRCRRCPKCGKKQQNQWEHCPSCGHPGDEDQLKELEHRLAPNLPRNKKVICMLDRRWQNGQLIKRIRGWRLLGLFAVLAPIVEVASFKVVGEEWGLGTTFLVIGLAWFGLLFLLRSGKCQWLLRKNDRSA